MERLTEVLEVALNKAREQEAENKRLKEEVGEKNVEIWKLQQEVTRLTRLLYMT